MDEGAPTWTLGWIAQLIGGDLHGPPEMPISGPVSADADAPAGIAFCESDEYLTRAARVGALVLPRDLASDKPHISVDQPRFAFGAILALADSALPIAHGIHPTAVVHTSAKVDSTASIGPYAVIEENVAVGPGARIYPFCYVGARCSIGANATLYPHVVLYKDVTIGDRSIIHSGAVIGADGFGFIWNGKKRIKVPQAGGVRLGDHVEIGANTTIDRATTGKTSIGDGTKLDNLVQIAHNCTIGDDTVIAGLAGISGSCRIGSRCVFGGQTALSDHVTVGDDVTFGGRTGTSQDILEPGAYFGAPAIPVGEGMRVYVMAPRVPELFKRVRALERALERLEKKD